MIGTSRKRVGEGGGRLGQATYLGGAVSVPRLGMGEWGNGRGEEGKRGRRGEGKKGRGEGPSESRRPKTKDQKPKAVALLLLLAVAVGSAFGQEADVRTDADSVVARAERDVRALASPAMAGRGYGAGGHLRAAAYIERAFEEIGLEPPEGGYRQAFPVPADVFLEPPRLAAEGEALRLGADFLPYAASGSGQGERVAAVDVGSGVVALEADVNAYAGTDVRGKIVVMRGAVPDSVRERVPSPFLSLEARLEVVARQGARAAVVLVDRLGFGSGIYNARLPAFEVLESAWPTDPASGAGLAVRQVSFDVQVEQDRAVTAYNLIGFLPGQNADAGRSDSTVILMAHYDGLGALGDSLYFPGANDNASGVAMLLALARYFQAHPPPYTLAFVAFSGEEKGLVGSRYFVENPPIDLQRGRFLLNFDMVASGEEGVVAVGGADFPAAYARLQTMNDTLGAGPLGKRSNAPNSDHFFLIQAGVPGFYLYTNRGTQPYHHVADVPETLDWDDFLHVYRLARGFLETMR